MKSIMLTMAVLAVSWSGARAQSLEALKAGTFEASWQLMRQAPPPPVPVAVPAPAYRHHPGGAVQTNSYLKGGYTWESDAQAARSQAENGLRSAGFQVISGQVYKEANFPFNYALRIDYLAQGWAPAMQTYTGGAFTWESDARAELARTVANFKSSGVSVILGQVKKQANFPFNYFYEVDYLQHRAGPPAGREFVYVSPSTYPNFNSAKWALDAEVRAFKSKGYRVSSGRVFRDYYGYKFELRYSRY